MKATQKRAESYVFNVNKDCVLQDGFCAAMDAIIRSKSKNCSYIVSELLCHLFREGEFVPERTKFKKRLILFAFYEGYASRKPLVIVTSNGILSTEGTFNSLLASSLNLENLVFKAHLTVSPKPW